MTTRPINHDIMIEKLKGRYKIITTVITTIGVVVGATIGLFAGRGTNQTNIDFDKYIDKAQYDQLLADYNQLESSYKILQDNYDVLMNSNNESVPANNDNEIQLQSQLDELQNKYDALNSKYQSLLQNSQNQSSSSEQSKPTSDQYLTNEYKAYETSSYDLFSGGSSFEMGGHKYFNGFTLGNLGYAYFNINKECKTINGSIGSMYRKDVSIVITGDGKILGTYDFTTGDLPIEFSIDVTNVAQLKFEITSGAMTKPTIGFGELIIY